MSAIGLYSAMPVSVHFVMWNDWYSMRKRVELDVIAADLTAAYAFRDRLYPHTHGWLTASIYLDTLKA